MEKIIGQGAEALIILNKNIIKRRQKKSYRLAELDEKIRSQRTKKEFKLLQKASKYISTPSVIKLNEKSKEIEMEFIDGQKLSEKLDSLPNKIKICQLIGNSIAKIHDQDIIHGDLTTSNMIYKDNKVYFIDFGLGFTSKRDEDKAVDLHLIKEALEAKHFSIAEECFKAIIKGYSISKNLQKVLERLKKVEARGRYKNQY